MIEPGNWVLMTSAGGQERRFMADDLPVLIGGGAECDVRLHGVSGSFQIGVLDGEFFIQPGKEARGLRLEGEPIVGSRWLKNGETASLDTARVRCDLDAGRLSLYIEGQITGGDTAPPDLEELARVIGDVDEVDIAPIAFRSQVDTNTSGSRARPNRPTVIVTIAFALLAVFGWFAFTAKSVELIIEPAPEELEIPGTLFKVQMGGRFLLRSGPHHISAQLEGYYPLDEVVEVGQSPDQSVRLEFTKLPGLITFVTEPDVSANVHVDGLSLGTTPLSDIEIVPGRHSIEYFAERYLSEVLELEVIGGHQRQTFSGTLTPNWAPVSVSSSPAGAEILVDGILLESTPAILELSAGERQVEVRLRGYNAWQDNITVLADQALTLPEVSLTQADGRVELVSNPTGAAVSVDGSFQGQTPLTLRLAPGQPHTVALTKPGYESMTRELSVSADSGQRIVVPMVAQLGIVEILSAPPAAQIFVDGELRGVTPAQLTLNAISHELELRLDGFELQSTTITPRPGFPQRWESILEELDTATGSGYPRVVQTSLGQELRLVLPGEFTMGSSRREQGRRSNEALRAVRLNNAFYLGIKEVSNAEFRAFKADHNSGVHTWVSLNEDDQPVVRITWEEAAQFVNWLSIKDGFQPVYEEGGDGRWTTVRPLRNGYRLPTEAEWAWAARFAAQEPPLTYPWGLALPPPDRSGNYADVSAAQLLPTTLVTYNDGFGTTAPAGSFDANAVGIFDLGGNVSEWVQDYYQVGQTQTETVLEDPLGPETGRFHVIRGANWRSATVTDLRSASRNYSVVGDEKTGFRIARNLE
jgi:formylglycine-generating enzyme required for sulfatase activity